MHQFYKNKKSEAGWLGLFTKINLQTTVGGLSVSKGAAIPAAGGVVFELLDYLLLLG